VRAAILVALAGALAACKSPAPAPTTAHPYKIVLLPIEGAQAALQEKPGENDVPLALTPDALEAKIAESVKASNVFSGVVVAEPAALKPAGDEDKLQLAAALAKKSAADLILRIEVKSARMTDLGNNESTFWSTLTWFMIPLPVWIVDDRTYDTDIAILAELYEPDDPVRPTLTVAATSGRQELDLWDRGPSLYVIVVPPPFLKGSPETVSETLTERAVHDMLAALVDGLRTREIPSRFEMDVKETGPAVAVTVASRRRLRSLAVEVDGTVVRTWAETGLVEDADSTPERFSYRRTVEPSAKAGASVRVIAEDEGGGREVRTLVIGGAR
jgi:hypothetical protein